MYRLILNMTEKERQALHILAERELRDPRLQAALIIRQELHMLGLLEIPTQTASNEKGAEQKPIEE